MNAKSLQENPELSLSRYVAVEPEPRNWPVGHIRRLCRLCLHETIVVAIVQKLVCRASWVMRDLDDEVEKMIKPSVRPFHSGYVDLRDQTQVYVQLCNQLHSVYRMISTNQRAKTARMSECHWPSSGYSRGPSSRSSSKLYISGYNSWASESLLGHSLEYFRRRGVFSLMASPWWHQSAKSRARWKFRLTLFMNQTIVET